MKWGDIILAAVYPNGTLSISDRYAQDVGLPALDTDIGGSNNLIDYSGFEEEGLTVVRFSRKLDTSDPKDTKIHPGLVELMFAFHPTSDIFVYHGPTRGRKFVNLLLKDCKAGTYFVNNTCKECPVGRYSRNDGAIECLPCEPGSYTNTTGSSICQLCFPGEYQEYLIVVLVT